MTQRAALLAVVLLGLFSAGCPRAARESADTQVTLTTTPSPPVVGVAAVAVQLADSAGKPISGATLRLEGNMNHAGMTPSFADLKDVGAGRYEGSLDFTMGGDWFILVNAKLPDGKSVERRIDVPGVKAR
jgi:hypothetical protein